MTEPLLDPDAVAQAGLLLGRLRDAGLTVCTAESCTGGLVAAALTHHSGSGDALLAGFVTYGNDAKHRMLGVDSALLSAHGAVSEPVAAAMAAGAVARGGSDLAVSITGIAGPTGGTPDKPVGLVWFGLHAASGHRLTRRHLFEGDRAAVRSAAVRTALSLLDDAIPAARLRGYRNSASPPLGKIALAHRFHAFSEPLAEYAQLENAQERFNRSGGANAPRAGRRAPAPTSPSHVRRCR